MALPSDPLALVICLLLQLMSHCSAQGSVHILLSVDSAGMVDDKYNLVLERNPVHVKCEGESIQFDPERKPEVQEASLIKLYITGKFIVEGDVMHWSNGRDAKALAGLVTKVVEDSEAVVLVVFPDTLQLYSGLTFLENFEEELASPNIVIGRETVALYVGINAEDDMTLDSEIKNMEKENPERNILKFDKRQNAIFVYQVDTQRRFATFRHAKNLPSTEKVSRVLIQEADTVCIRLVSHCAENDAAMTVGSKTTAEVADILKQLLGEKTASTHRYQRVHVKLPSRCEVEAKNIISFTEGLVDALQKLRVDAFGKQPSAVLHMASEEMWGEVLKKRESEEGKGMFFVNIDDDRFDDARNIEGSEGEGGDIANAKELFLHVHCHGSFEWGRSAGAVCGLQPKNFANKMHSFLKNVLGTNSPETIQLTFLACNVGSKAGTGYLHDFLSAFHESNDKIVLKEIITYKSWVSQNGADDLVTLPLQVQFGSKEVIDAQNEELQNLQDLTLDIWQIDRLLYVNSNHVFGRFTVRTILGEQNKYSSFDRLPATELELAPPES